MLILFIFGGVVIFVGVRATFANINTNGIDDEPSTR
jgi:hypothetical protein